MKKTIVKLIAVLALCFMVGAVLVACKAEAGPKGDKGDKGDTGATGATGATGENGLTPEIKDGYWWIGETNTGVKAEGVDGAAGAPAPVCAEHKNTNHVLKSTTLTNDETCEIVLSVCNECGFAAINVECGHNYIVDADVTKTYAATCYTDGLTTKVCEGCGDVQTETHTATGNHVPAVAWDPTNIDTTVWTAGQNEIGCECVAGTPYTTTCTTTGCGATIAEMLDAAGHSAAPWVDGNIQANLDAGWKLAEKPANITICDWAPVYVYECDNCYDDADHKHCLETKVLAAPGCVADIPAATCTQDQVCTVCGEIMAEKLGHTISNTSNKAITLAPTYEAAGTAVIYCDVCSTVGAPVVAVEVVLPALNADLEAEENYEWDYVGGNTCSDLDYEYTYTYVNGDETVTVVFTFVVDAEIEHSEAPALEDCLIVEKNGKKYYMYECEKCHIFIVVKVEDVVAP